MRYAEMALPVIDTFLKGIYWRNVPQDMTHGQMQTLVGMTTFEVIHEDAIGEITEAYRLLRGLIDNESQEIYDKALKKWADNIIDNGVPHNNWNLLQAEFIWKIALSLRSDSTYNDGQGREYYLDHIVNRSKIRQWSMKRLADFAFDKATGIWYESPGYSTMVVNDFAAFANSLDHNAGIDLFQHIPILKQSLSALPQYLMPNRMICGFGDTHPTFISTKGIDNMLDYASRHGMTELADSLCQLKEAIAADAPNQLTEQYVSPSFHAPNVSWLIQRTGMDKRHDLCISLNGSLGNHQHANGISMELYGKGYVLGPDAGIGHKLYSGDDYRDYYSQFPAHNTVCVNGKSSYPVMMSNHDFKVQARHPETNKSGDFTPVTFSQVCFKEPETEADQLRTNGIVKYSKEGGYYVDIFRSRTDGKQFHDYFYHNLGQRMELTDCRNASLGLQPTDELAFAGGHLYAYSYIYNKETATTDSDVKATFTTECGDGRSIYMNMWMQGAENRDVFKALSPVNMEYERMAEQPYRIIDQPVLTFIARQHGEAWTHPFVAVFEPSDNEEPSGIMSVEFFRPESKSDSAVGIKVSLNNGRVDYIFSAPEKTKMKHLDMKVNAIYAIFSNGEFILSK